VAQNSPILLKKYAAIVPSSKLSIFYFPSYIIIIFFIKSNFLLNIGCISLNPLFFS